MLEDYKRNGRVVIAKFYLEGLFKRTKKTICELNYYKGDSKALKFINSLHDKMDAIEQADNADADYVGGLCDDIEVLITDSDNWIDDNL